MTLSAASALDFSDPFSIPGTRSMIPLQREMHYQMMEYTKERLAKWKTQLLTKFFNITRLKYFTFIGSFSWTCETINMRWLYQPITVNYGSGQVTPADLARDYLSVKFPNRKIKCTSDQWHKCVDPEIRHQHQPPIICKPGEYRDMVYLDLKGAFWQIIRAVGWDVNYNPGKYLAKGADMTDFPYPDNKLARNCLVSIGLPTPLRFWDGQKLGFRTRNSRFVNLIAWRLVQDVLNGVALDMQSVGCVYTYTDCYIVPRSKLESAFEILDRWQLIADVRHDGDVKIVAPTCYAFRNGRKGSYQTRNYDDKRFNRRANRERMKVYDPGIEWLRPRFAPHAHQAIVDWSWLNEKGELK